MKRLKGFTLAEVLITLAIIGVVAALTIPSVISNSQQQEFKTGLRKAVSVLNSAITMNMAIDGESPYDNANLFGYLQKHMSILRSTRDLRYDFMTKPESGGNNYNSAFYTTDGMRFEFNNINGDKMVSKLHESDTYLCINTKPKFSEADYAPDEKCNGCGSYGLNHNPNGTTKPPCLIMVDVNGDKKPTPGNVNYNNVECGLKSNVYKVPLPAEKKG